MVPLHWRARRFLVIVVIGKDPAGVGLSSRIGKEGILSTHSRRMPILVAEEGAFYSSTAMDACCQGGAVLFVFSCLSHCSTNHSSRSAPNFQLILVFLTAETSCSENLCFNEPLLSLPSLSSVRSRGLEVISLFFNPCQLVTSVFS